MITVWNRIAMIKENNLVKETPGQLVEVDDHKMSIYTEGEGDHTIVLMSGWGTASPMYDFRPLYEKLSDEYRIVVIEKFGYGFSDEYEGDRDFDTMLRQDREALEQAGISGPYVLCAHSLSGLEATLWAQKYPEEVEAVIGLDMTLANSYDNSSNWMLGLEKGISSVVGFTGINRPTMMMSDLSAQCHTDREKEQCIALYCANATSDTIMRDMDGIDAVWEEINASPLPSAPTIQYISGANKGNKLWVEAHQKYVDASSDGKLVQLECGHYVHTFESERIAKDMKEFIGGLGK